ncbi:MAG: iron-sulfur cluster assembly scaffold protein [Pseudomonadota bacterium]
MTEALYSPDILRYAANLPPACRLASPDASAKKVSRVCGSEVEVDIALDGDVVSDFALEARACALGQASASIVAERLIGATAQEIHAARDAMRRMLKDDGPPPDGRFAALAALKPIKAYPQRHASTLLIFEALAACLDQALPQAADDNAVAT